MPPHMTVLHDAENPLDNIEDVLASNNWVYNRLNDDELVVQVAGRACGYRLMFVWQDDMNALQFCCQFDLTIQKPQHESAAHALMKMNEQLWMGHFDLSRETGVPAFRHTCLLRGMTHGSGAEMLEDLVDIALAQCERHYPVFHVLAHAANSNDQHLALALMETAGQS